VAVAERLDEFTDTRGLRLDAGGAQFRGLVTDWVTLRV